MLWSSEFLIFVKMIFLKFFLSFFKNRKTISQIQKYWFAIVNPRGILKKIHSGKVINAKINSLKINYLNKISLPILPNCQKQIRDAIITEKELYDTLKSMENDKTPVNNGLSKEFYELFWDDVKIPLLASINEAFIKEQLSTTQQQAVIKLVEKIDRDLLRTGDQYPC